MILLQNGFKQGFRHKQTLEDDFDDPELKKNDLGENVTWITFIRFATLFRHFESILFEFLDDVSLIGASI